MAYVPTTLKVLAGCNSHTAISVANYVITVSTPPVYIPSKKSLCLRSVKRLQDYQIYRVLSDTQLEVITYSEAAAGKDKSLLNPTQFDGGTLTYAEDVRNKIGYDIVLRAVYADEPAVALRNVLVNKYGAFIDENAPLPVTGNIVIDSGTIPSVWTEIDLAYDSNDNLIQVQYLNPTVERTLTLSYDSDDNLTKVVAS